jgi:hypothetical protein
VAGVLEVVYVAHSSEFNCVLCWRLGVKGNRETDINVFVYLA